ncbi:MAG TPA: hypothetical protein VGJ20_12525 [Xanthobacteraceae bacterium]|jgi:3-(3-hydroxy-phenyl)propionate hydroxylase
MNTKNCVVIVGADLAENSPKLTRGKSGEEQLDLYSRQTRHVAVDYVQAQAIWNKRMLEECDPIVWRRKAPAAA